MIPGIDCSKWSGEIDHQTVKDSGLVEFVIDKATEGTSYTDPEWYDNKEGWASVGMPDGAYHFFRPAYDPISQANHFVSTVGANINVYVCDVETTVLAAAMEAMKANQGTVSSLFGGVVPSLKPKDLRGRGSFTEDEYSYIFSQLHSDEGKGIYGAGMTSLSLAEKIQTFMSRVTILTGKVGVIYTSPAFWNGNVKREWIWDMPYDLWIAHWGVDQPIIPEPWSDWTFWQYTTSLRIPGIPSYEDGNWAHDDMNVYEYFGNGQEPPPPPQGFQVKVIADNKLYMRKIPYGTIVGNLVNGNILTVTRTVKDIYGKDWYYSGDNGCFAGWWTIPYP